MGWVSEVKEVLNWVYFNIITDTIAIVIVSVRIVSDKGQVVFLVTQLLHGVPSIPPGKEGTVWFT